MIRSTEFHLLYIFDALVRFRSVTRAAQHLNFSQPTVSVGLSRLRFAFSDELFVREGGEMVPTRLAQALIEPIQQALRQFSLVAKSARVFSPADSARTFRIVCADYFALLLGPDLLRRMMAEAPGCVLHLMDNARLTATDALELEQVDLLLDYEQTIPAWARGTALAQERLFVVARAGHPALAGAGTQPGQPLPLDTYCALPHLLRSALGVAAGPLDDALAALGRTRRVAGSAGTFMGLARLVASTDCLAALPAHMLPLARHAFALEAYEFPDGVGSHRHNLSMYWHQSFDGDASHLWLRRIVQEIATDSLAPQAGQSRAGPDR